MSGCIGRILSAPPGLSYLIFYHSVEVGGGERAPLLLPPTVHYSRGGGWYEFVGMPARPPEPPGCLQVRYGEVYAIESSLGVYVGSALGYSTGRWATHLRMLREGRHHCKALQVAFLAEGVSGLKFRIIADDVPEGELREQEYEWTKALDGVNSPPASEVRRETRRIICLDLEGGTPYREIAHKHGVSLATVAAVKAKYRVKIPDRKK